MNKKGLTSLILSSILMFSFVENKNIVQAYNNNQGDTVNKIITKGVNNTSIENTLKVLTSDEFEGRLPGNKGNYMTVDYIKDKFEKIGLDKYNDDSYFQTYNQNVFYPKEANYYFEVEFNDGKKKKYKYSEDFMDNAKFEKFDLTADITFDVNDDKLSDKILVADKYVSTKVKPKALLYVKNDFMGYANVGTPKSDMRLQISKELFDELNMQKVKCISIKVSNKIENIKVNNIIGKISGNNNKNALVLSAHFDHVGYAGSKIFRGAVDNASGTSVLLELAQKLKEQSQKNKFDMDILICALNGEESGPFTGGGKFFANDIKGKYENIYDINLDTLGKKDGGDLIIEGDEKFDKELFEDLSKYPERYKIKYKAGNYNMGSDHWSFMDKNICAVNLGQENVYQSGTGIHTVKDTIEIVDLEYLGKIVSIVYDFIVESNGKVYKWLEIK